MLVFMSAATSGNDDDYALSILAKSMPEFFDAEFFANHKLLKASQSRMSPQLAMNCYQGFVEMIDRQAAERLAAYRYANGPHRQAGQPVATLVITADPDAAYKAEYKANQHLARMSEAEYIASRRIDDGLDQLSAQAAEPAAPINKLADWLASNFPVDDSPTTLANPLLGDGQNRFAVGSVEF